MTYETIASKYECSPDTKITVGMKLNRTPIMSNTLTHYFYLRRKMMEKGYRERLQRSVKKSQLAATVIYVPKEVCFVTSWLLHPLSCCGTPVRCSSMPSLVHPLSCSGCTELSHCTSWDNPPTQITCTYQNTHIPNTLQ